MRPRARARTASDPVTGMHAPIAAAPLYETVKRHVTDGIATGRYAPGAKLPSESELVSQLSVSRMTVNRALRELSRDGIITRVQGVGSFVATTAPNTSLSEVRDIRDIIAERGGTHRCRVLDARRTRLDAALAPLFEAAPGLEVFHLTVLHCENGRPLQIERRHVRADFAPDLLDRDLHAMPLTPYLQALAPISELEHVVEAASPDGDERQMLELGDGEPVLRIRRRTWVGDRVVTLSLFSHPGSRYRATIRLRPSDTA